jgi:hypothetical protein
MASVGIFRAWPQLGSNVNVVTRSGSNQLHGDLYEFFRNKALNTRGFFDSEKSKFNQNQFGGTLGGPIRHDRLFFFSLEDRQIRQGISSDLVSVPSSAQRAGDFSGAAPFTGMLQDDYLATMLNRRPGCAGAIAAGGGAPLSAYTPWSAIFLNNKVPAKCFDSTAVDLLNQFVPLPNVGGGLYQSVPVLSEAALQPTLRLDYSLSAKHQLSFYEYFNDGSIQQPFARFRDGGALHGALHDLSAPHAAHRFARPFKDDADVCGLQERRARQLGNPLARHLSTADTGRKSRSHHNRCKPA